MGTRSLSTEIPGIKQLTADAENQTKLRNFHCFSSSQSLL